jgi:uncharacterized protein (TIGR02391 family)
MNTNKNKGLSTTKLIKQLWENKYFASAHDALEIKEKIATLGFNIQPSIVSVALIRSVRVGRFLSRVKNDGRWVYIQRQPPAVQEVENEEQTLLYNLHPQIKKVSWKQFKDGNYKESAQNALVEVVDQVKIKAGHPKSQNGKEYDGDDLMNRVFGCDNQTPIIKLNSLVDSLDKAEQRGMMNLFKGIVGIRDKKAHHNFIQNDPQKALEYLALASLLMRLLDESST